MRGFAQDIPVLAGTNLQVSVEGAWVRLRVVFEENDGVGNLRSVLRSLQEIERAEVASNDRPFGNADGPIGRLRN
jgi:hypothetical protein